MRFKGFIGPTYKLNSVNVDCQRTVNLFPVINEMGQGKEAEIAFLKSTPGLIKIAEAGAGPGRLTHVDPQGRVFIASGTEMFLLTKTGGTWSVELIGNLETTTGIISAASTQIGDECTTVFVDGLQCYLYWSAAPSAKFGTFNYFGYTPVAGASQVEFIDGYFIFSVAGSNMYYVTAWNSVSVDPLDFASSEGNPDSIVAIISNHRDLWILNEQTIELYSNNGSSDFPFERVSGGFIEKGCVATYSVAKIDGIVVWLGRDKSGEGIVYAAQGLSPQRISTHAVEEAIQSYADISQATSYTYQKDGHSFYVLNFAEASWCYNFTTRLWHELAYTNEGVLSRHRLERLIYVPDHKVHVGIDYENEKIYVLDSNTYTDDGAAITRMRVAPHISQSSKYIRCDSFELDMETGIGLSSGQGSNPLVVLTWSDDRGHTWNNEQMASAGSGLLGEYDKRVIFRRLGRFRDRVFKVVITDPVPVTLIGAELKLKGGMS